jgi:hypothetical protein
LIASQRALLLAACGKQNSKVKPIFASQVRTKWSTPALRIADLFTFCRVERRDLKSDVL